MFLLQHAGRLDPLRRELAALVRAKADVYVVLALREEYLASLEVLTNDIVNIYASTFRLEHLTGERRQGSYRRPVEAYGVTVEQPELENALIADLKATALEQPLEHAGPAVGEANIELPHPDSSATSSGRIMSATGLTLGLYERMGWRDGIMGLLAGLAEGLSPQEQDDAANGLDWLAPRSGLKATCSVDQLAALTKLPGERIKKLMTHFEKNRVLREIAGQRYELYHDAFTKVLRRWIDERQEHAKESARRRQRRRKVQLLAAGICTVVFALVAVRAWINWFNMPDPGQRLRRKHGAPAKPRRSTNPQSRLARPS